MSLHDIELSEARIVIEQGLIRVKSTQISVRSHAYQIVQKLDELGLIVRGEK